MASSSLQVLSPSPSVVDPEDFVTPYHKSATSKGKMLNIQALLNPSVSNNSELRGITGSATPPPTPASTPTSTFFATSQPAAPIATSSSKHQKQAKDAAVVNRKDVRGIVNYPPFECREDAVCLSSIQQQELDRQHKLFQVFPYSENEQDLIADYTRHIPYSSERKSFGGKTGRDGFDGKGEQFMSVCPSIDKHDSLPVFLPHAWRTDQVYRDVGLQQRTRAYYAVLQVMQLHESTFHA